MSLPELTHVTFIVFNLSGEKAATLIRRITEKYHGNFF